MERAHSDSGAKLLSPKMARWMPPGLAGARPLDLLAGLTLAAMAIPEALGYSLLAGMPPVTGLYCMLLPVAAYVLLASSRQIVVGPDSSTAPIVFAALLPFAAAGSPRFVAMAATLSIIVGVILLVVWIARLSVLADFLSRPVLAGFLAGIGVTVVVSQLPDLLGITVTSHRSLFKIWEIITGLGSADAWTATIGVLSIAVIVLLHRFAHRWPAQLSAVVLAALLVWVAHLQQHGVATVGAIPHGLPSLGFPTTGWADIGRLLGPAFAIVVLIVAQTVATGQSYAFKRSYRFMPGREIAALTLANLAAGFSGTYVVNASATKTDVVDSAGGRSQLASLLSIVVVVAILLVGGGLIAVLPVTAVAAVVIVAGTHLIDVRMLRDVLRARPTEFIAAVIGGLAVVCLSITWGFGILVVLSIADRLRIARRPSDSAISLVPGRGWHERASSPDGILPPGFIAYRFSSSLYFPNAAHFRERVIELVEAEEQPRWLVVDASAIVHIDYTGGLTLLDVCRELGALGVQLVLADLTADQRRQLRILGVEDCLGKEHFYDTLEQAVRAYLDEQGLEWLPAVPEIPPSRYSIR